MLLDSSMLILDEATSNVDIVTEADISGAMVKLMKIKHALSLPTDCLQYRMQTGFLW